MKYKELQKQCKMLGLRACGKADVLRKRLNDYYNGDTDSSPKNVLSDEIAELRKIVMSNNLQLKNENQRLKNEIQKLKKYLHKDKLYDTIVNDTKEEINISSVKDTNTYDVEETKTFGVKETNTSSVEKTNTFEMASNVDDYSLDDDLYSDSSDDDINYDDISYEGTYMGISKKFIGICNFDSRIYKKIAREKKLAKKKLAKKKL